MGLTPGIQLGRFEIVSPLGQGGMGEVYLARDLNLGRQVALKVLTFSGGDVLERVERFEREARLLASLSHPHIGSIFGFESVEDNHFLILELVPGPTLDAWLKNRPSRNDILQLFVQIAEGLEAAHSRGIVHRDLKPANIKIAASGSAKILDFGIADVLHPLENQAADGDTLELPQAGTPHPPGNDAEKNSEKAGETHTHSGAAMIGTLPYMSPEQARGQAVGRQADIWSFGCLLYEALSGGRAFPGNASPDVLVAILRHDPDWEKLPRNLPPRLLRLIRRCLDRNPYNRMHHIADVRIELQGILDDELETRSASSPRRRAWAVALVLAFLVATVLAFISNPQPRASLPEKKKTARLLEISLPDDAPIWLWWWRPVPALAISPDGRQVVYVADRGLGTQLYLRNLDASSVTALEGTEDARHPFFSPDGKSLAYFSETELLTIDLQSLRIRKLLEVMPESSGGSWADDGYLCYTPSPTSPVFRVSEPGGAAEPVTKLDASRGESASLA